MPDAPDVCRRCRKPFPEGETADPHGWCARCFAQVVRASTYLAVVPALLVAGFYGWLIVTFGLMESRFVVVFLALGVVLTWLTFKIARRVAFDVVRARKG